MQIHKVWCNLDEDMYSKRRTYGHPTLGVFFNHLINNSVKNFDPFQITVVYFKVTSSVNATVSLEKKNVSIKMYFYPQLGGIILQVVLWS